MTKKTRRDRSPEITHTRQPPAEHRTAPKSPESVPSSGSRRKRGYCWTDGAIQAILGAAPTDDARAILLQNPEMMAALLRKAQRDDGSMNHSVLRRILSPNPSDDDSAARLRSRLHEREEELRIESQRVAEGKARLMESQAKLNILTMEKQRANSEAARAREEARQTKASLEALNRAIQIRDEALRKMEMQYEELDAEAAKLRTRNKNLKLKEAHTTGRATGRVEGREQGRRQARRESGGESYSRGFDEGYNYGVRSSRTNSMEWDTRVFTESPKPMPGMAMGQQR
ncbi:hypothetical protein FRB99_006351 [Tulasnella sp. 403]|nr:hypothetical protein FRB99_006351 [Tulasnella sp. 403]